MKILVTGGEGMVGSNFRAIASRYGHQIDAPNHKSLDLNNYSHLFDYLNKTKPEAIIHCAGIVGGIQANIAKPYDFCYGNLVIGMNIVDAAYKSGVHKLINLGSSCMYPRNAKNPLMEKDILNGELEPTNEGYAVAKIAIAKLIEYQQKQFDVSYKTLIPCNLYGYWDKFDLLRSHMIPSVIRKLHEAKLTNQQTVKIWGDGCVRREYLFAQDFAEFLCYALEHYYKLPNNMNVGFGEDYTIEEYYRVIADVIGFTGSFEYDLDKPSGMHQKKVDLTVQKGLGWKPMTDLVTGIQKTYYFYTSKIA